MGLSAKMLAKVRAKTRIGGVALCCCCAASVSAGAGSGAGAGDKAKTVHRTVARPVARAAVLSVWERAVQGREELEALPQGERTKAQFTRVLDGFRVVYHDDPSDRHAADAVYAVAELLREQGRALGDGQSLRAAVGQYEFLRTQYPASTLRVAALLAEARIEDEDLGEPAEAGERYREIVREYPRSGAAKEARGALADHKADSATRLRGLQEESGDKMAKVAPVAKLEVAPTSRLEVPAGKRKAPARVTGIRHWSTATYTRVAIDLGDEVTFEAARVPHPDRIYFDLHGARLDQELAGKSFDVMDDGFLKKIRAAQASGDVTRVVLDVNDVTEYTAFLLPNPYRLIIDIHGGAVKKTEAGPDQVQAKGEPRRELAEALGEMPVKAGAGKAASAAANVSGLPAMAVTNGETVGAPGSIPGARVGAEVRATAGRPVPNTRTVKAPATTNEVTAVSELPGKVEGTSAPTSRPIAVVSLGRRQRKERATKQPSLEANATPARAAERMADGQTSMIRALGLRIGRIVIDAGHGGHDSGTLGVDGLQEKDVVLDVALRLGKLLHERLGAEIIYTRSDDTFIPLETRTAIANKAQADLFLSVHANSSSDASARGVETYYLNFTSSPDALETAARENAVSGQSIHQLSDLVKKITLKDKIAESREFASDVEGSLYAGLQRGNDGLKNRGVKKAPFVVLIGANMPSILAEISFVTNARDAGQLRTPEYRERVAESLFAGVAKYENGLAEARTGPGMKGPEVTRASTE